MYIHSKNHSTAIQSVKIDIGLSLGLEKDEDAWIELKEMPAIELLQFRKAVNNSETEALGYFRQVLPVIIRDHNLMLDESRKMSSEDVTALLYEKFFAIVAVVEKYTSASFFSQDPRHEGR